ncbi:MAG: protein kinase domain-containing protein, partial [bacterium]
MEYIEGYSLREFIEKGKNKDLNLSLEIFLQILDGVEYAHGKGVVHRDLKPENIMLTKDNVVKITDFGIAFALGSHSITNPGVLMGTLAYLSPEQAQGINVDQQTDIYSLGVILYELLTSNLPIVAVNPASMIYKILNENPLPPTKYNPNIPQQIEKIILKCLQKDKKLRYQNISQIKKDFEDYFLILESEQTISSVKETSQKANIKENINELVQKTIGDILSEISSYKKNIQDIFYENPEKYKTNYKESPEKPNLSKQDQTITLNEISSSDEIKIKDLNKPYKEDIENIQKPFSSTDIEIYLSKAQKEYENKNYQETIKILELILPYYKSKNILYVLAKSYYKLGNLQKSLYYIDLYKLDYGESEKILSLEGDVLYNLKDFPNSYISYYKVYEITGDRFYLLLSAKAAVNYQPETAIDHLSSVISSEKDQHVLLKSYKYMGLAYYKMGNYDLAIQNWENYLKHYSDKDLIPALIKSYKMAGKNLELAKIYSALLQYTEDQHVLKEALSFYISTGKYKEAIEVCYKLLSLNSDDLSVYQDLYLASKAISNTPSLILAIENILRLHEELSSEAKVELMEELLLLYQEEQQHWDAINIINQLIKTAGKKIEYSYQLADLLSKTGKYEEALNIIYELISVDSSNALFYEKLAEIYHKLGQLEQAIQTIQTAISIDPTNYKYYKILSNFYLEAGKIGELVVILKNLIEYNADELEAYILLAQVYLSLKNYSEAYEYTLMAYSRANSREMEIPLKIFDIMLHAMAGVFKESQLINKFKEMVFEIKNPKYIPYLYLSISFFYWSKGFEVNSLEYLNNLLMISKNLDKTIFILANSMISHIKG